MRVAPRNRAPMTRPKMGAPVTGPWNATVPMDTNYPLEGRGG
ncbi:hypothetical protein MBEHAL_1418 [Halarchaeum acidiphilum MH1-52-1]|uniref:Uncharacterized protein n=1 Tax=Halarchaeum acidiphilum MH1-52-1 TaxID=1261545 RepID=U3AD06_9EURY|nr:hypothetical protein MBEHAL_1418 [Halarchaeum acidiphilum MH1-52-1]